MKILVFGLALFMIYSCSEKPDSPEGLLKLYINDLATKDVDLDYHLQRTTGELRASIESSGLEEFKKSEELANVKKVDVSILHKNCSSDRCVLTYTVAYELRTDNKVSSYNESRKIAKLLKVDDEWKLAEITNIKTFIDSKDPINPLLEQN